MLERERESVCVHTCESGSGCVKWVCEKERERVESVLEWE
jgi:hypothetical protein